MKRVLPIATALFFANPVLAQHAHQKGPNGGHLEDVAGLHVEMVVSGRTLTFNVFDDAVKPTSAKGLTGSVLLLNAGEREMLPLVAGETAMKAEAKKDIAPGSTVTITVKSAQGKSGQAKFVN